MGKNVAVFVDVANIFYAAKAAGVDIDYVTLLKSATAGRDFVRAYAYTGLDPDNENQRNFHSFLARNHYKVVSKDIRKYGDGKVKANLDIELVVDLMKTARNLDVAIVVSGDGDFAPAIRAVQEMGVRVEVISFRGNTSSDLIDVADLFTDITQLARVEKGSSRSGRRVAGDDEDLSMTEVPDKQTEGTGPSRGRGRGRGRGRAGEAEPVAARGRSSSNGSRASVSAAGLTALPGEKLSKAGSAAAEAAAGPELDDLDADEGAIAALGGGGEQAVDADGESQSEGEGDGRRRRRRRGGRGRGRGRGRELEGGVEPGIAAGGEGPAEPASDADLDVDLDVDVDDEDEIEVAAAPRGPRPTPFGSVWDSQLGVPRSDPSTIRPAAADDEDFDEPEIPEYLIAEQRRGQQGNRGGRGGQPNRGGARGGRAGYAAAIDRERYGRGGGGGGINRYPDVSAREAPARGGRPDSGFARQDRGPRPERFERGDRPAGPRSSEPWSEVPEELEAMLRAQLAQSPKAAPPAGRRDSARAGTSPTEAVEATASDAAPEAPVTKRRTTRKKAEPAAGAAAIDAAGAESSAEAPATKRRTTRKTASTGTDEGTGATAAPKRRTTRTKAVAADAAAAETGTDSGGAVAEEPAPKRRTTRKKAETA